MSMIDNIELAEMQLLLEEAFRSFYEFDAELLNYQTEDDAVSERCIVFRIGWYLQTLLQLHTSLKVLSVDSEYNRCFDHPKSMYKVTLDGIQEKIGNAIPDLIIHQRKSNANNLAIFEFKKAGKYAQNGKSEDFIKLKYFTNPNNEYKFKFGFWIVLYKKKVDIHIFQEGQEKSHLKYTWKVGAQTCSNE